MSRTVILDIRNGKFPPATIAPGTYVVWRNLDPIVHSAETLGSAAEYFSAGAMLPGATSSPILFQKEGAIDYLCRYHSGMTGRIEVQRNATDHGGHGGHHDHGGHGNGGHSGHHLNHLHGFVTGGRSSGRIYMSHTPVLADERHNYQIILQAHFDKPEQGRLYDELRASPYGGGMVQIFHEHIAMPDLGNGTIKSLPHSSASFYPQCDGLPGPNGLAKDIPGLEENVSITIDQVLHFHQFDTEADRPDALTYLIYGDEQDVFIDHYMDRAPSFHSVAKLRSKPPEWDGKTLQKFTVPGKSIRDLPARLIERVAIVDNAFHLFWLPPPGALPRQAQDPLIPRNPEQPPTYAIKFDGGQESKIEIEHFLQFDIRLMNYGVLIP